MRISVLASGSAGNAVYVASGRTRLVVDAGLSPREVERRLLRAGAGAEAARARLDAVLVTHEHGDHARHARSFASQGVPLYATDGTASALGVAARPLRVGGAVRIGGVEVEAVRVPHDAREPVGFVITGDGGRVGVLTDCGIDSDEVVRALSDVDVLVVELNHDERMLRLGPYPFALKRRIAGARGHLSNVEGARLVRRAAELGRAPGALVLAHLSSTNNTAALALAAIEAELGGRVPVVVARQGRPTSWIDVRPGGVDVPVEHAPLRRGGARVGVAGQQLAFGFT